MLEIIQGSCLLKRKVSLSVGDKNRDEVVELEKEIWIALELVSKDENKTIDEIIRSIDSSRMSRVPLASAIKVFVISYLLFEKVQTEEAKVAYQKIIGDQKLYQVSSSKNDESLNLKAR